MLQENIKMGNDNIFFYLLRFVKYLVLKEVILIKENMFLSVILCDGLTLFYCI